MAKKTEKKYPRTLYKSGGPNKWGKDKYYSSVDVNDEIEETAAKTTGYLDSFHDALFGKEGGKNASKEREIKKDDF